MAIDKVKVFAAVDDFEAAFMALTKLAAIPQSHVLQLALNHHGSELAEYIIWDAQKIVLAQNAVSDMEDDHVTMGDDA